MATLSSRRIAAVVALAMVGTLVLLAPSPAKAKGRPQHNSVFINKNSAFTKANGVRSGSGTAMDPYVISGWTFSNL